MRVVCRPLSNFPAPETRMRRRAPFHRRSATGGVNRVLLSDSLDLLAREARALKCKDLVIEADFREGDIRLDGWPYANAKPRSPRVVVSMLQSRYGPLRYPCDTFDRFEDNVRAVGLALEALRRVDRYGVTRRGEQYAGWKALPPAGSTTMTAEAAAACLARFAATVTPAALLRDYGLVAAAVREAVKATHPDTGGTEEDFRAVQTARAVLRAHHGEGL